MLRSSSTTITGVRSISGGRRRFRANGLPQEGVGGAMELSYALTAPLHSFTKRSVKPAKEAAFVMKQTFPDRMTLLERSSLYRERLAEREEILKHKWLESEKASRDIGLENALLS
jgi:hypothetical protein